MNEGLITVRYVKALYELAAESKVLEKVRADADMLLGILSESDEFNAFIQSPIIKKSEKIRLFSELFAKSIDPLSLQFLHLLCENNREMFLKEICLYYIKYFKKQKGIQEAVITTATPLSKKHKKEIYDFITKKFKVNIELTEKTEPEIIGGFVLRIEDQQINASMRAQLNKIRRELIHT